MSIRRSNIKKTLAPAFVLMGLVFFLFSRLPTPEGSHMEKSSSRQSARLQLEKELAIAKPREVIGVSGDKRRAVQTTNGAGEWKDEHDGRPLQKALKSYLEAHRNLDLSASTLPSGRKWLIYTPGVVGWGNRLQGMYLALAVSLATNRTLLVDWTTPVPLTELVKLTEEVPVLLPPHLRKHVHNVAARNANAWDHANGYLNYPKDVLRGENLQLWKESIVHFSAGEDWLNDLLQNRHLQDDLMRVFGTHPEHTWSERSLQLIAHELLAFIVHDLSPAAKDMFERSAIFPSFRDGVSMVSIQIRIGTNNTSFDPFVDEEKDVPKFWECAKALLKAKSNSGSDWKVFLATDSITVKQKAVEAFGKDLLFFDGPIVHSGNEQVTDETGKGRSIDGLLKVVVDWWLLGESQYMFRSRQSTFGRSATIRRPTASLVLPTQYADGCPLPVILH